MFVFPRRSRAGGQRFILDLSYDDFEQYFGEPRRRGQPVTINGKTIPQEEISRIRVTKTEYESSYYRSAAESRLRTDWAGIIPGPSLEWIIADQGEDITNELITGPPGSESESDSGNSRQFSPATDSREVFVVHGRNLAARDACLTSCERLTCIPSSGQRLFEKREDHCLTLGIYWILLSPRLTPLLFF